MSSLTNGMTRRLVVASAIAVVVAAVFLPGSGFGSSAARVRGEQWIPARLADAIHARFGAGAIRSSSAAQASDGPNLGYSVAMSADGTTALVGAPVVANGKGAAYIFHSSDAGSWTSSDTPTATLTNKPGPATGQYFGFNIALSADGTTAFVGAPLVGSGSGAIYVFHASAEDAWASSSTPAATLNANQGILVGYAVAASPDGTTVVAGAPIYHSEAGGAYIFHASSEDTWTSTSFATATLNNAAQDPNDGDVGLHVAISGDGTTVLVSDDLNPTGGGAYVYHVSAEDSWASSSTPTAILTDANTDPSDVLGNSLALSGDGTVAFVGDPVGNSGTGLVDVFQAAGEAAWATTSIPTATLTTVGGAQGDAFGLRVGVSGDGTTALVSAPGFHHARGAAYIFRVADEGSWADSSAPTATLTDSGGHASDILALGTALSADGATALLGAPGVRFQTGAADVFHVLDASSWATSSAPTAMLSDSALDQCVVPRLRGLTITAAKTSLRARSCRLGRVRRVHSHVRKGHVVSQSRTSGSRLPVGTRVAIKVAR